MKPITTVCGQNEKFLKANVVRKVKAKLFLYLSFIHTNSCTFSYNYVSVF